MNCTYNAAFRLRARSDRVDRSDTIDTIATIAQSECSITGRTHKVASGEQSLFELSNHLIHQHVHRRLRPFNISIIIQATYVAR